MIWSILLCVALLTRRFKPNKEYIENKKTHHVMRESRTNETKARQTTSAGVLTWQCINKLLLMINVISIRMYLHIENYGTLYKKTDLLICANTNT